MVAWTPRSPFLQFEVLGPRADLEAWLASVQDTGVCHLADALDDLEGHAGIGRPSLRAEEVHAELLRSDAAQALRGVARVLPPTPRTEADLRRPQWSIGAGGVGELEVHALKDEARGIARQIGDALEDVHEREVAVERLDALEAARAALESHGASVFSASLWRLPRRAGPAAARALARRIRRAAGVEAVLRGQGERGLVVVLPGAGDAATTQPPALELDEGAERIEVPAALQGATLVEARSWLATELADAQRAEAEARAVLSGRVAESGVRGRFLLDSLDDADSRTAARRYLASSEHVTAARLYVRREDEPRLRETLHAAHGESVVLRPLAGTRDAPSLPRRIAASPFAVIESLRAARYGDVSPASVLALVTPLAVGLVWADVAGGVFLLLAGALLGSGAGRGSPRRDTALLAQVGGLVSLVLGVLAGQAFGPAGVAWFGTDWGLASDPASFLIGREAGPEWAVSFLGVAWALGAVSALAALWGVALGLWARSRGRAARARAAWLGAAHFAAVSGLAAATLPAGHALGWAWILAPIAAIGVLVVGGPRRFLLQFCLDLVGVLRLVAVAGAALLVFHAVLAAWIDPSVAAILVGILGLVVAALAVVADPAHLAMGVPYDLALGGKRLGQPFEPFRRQLRDASSSMGWGAGTTADDAGTEAAR